MVGQWVNLFRGFLKVLTSIWSWTPFFAICSQVQLNPFSLITNNLLTLISGTWGEQFQAGLFCLLPNVNFITEIGSPLGHVQKGLQEYLYINHCGIFWSLVSYSIDFFSCEDFWKHRRGPWWTGTTWWM